MVDKEKAKLIKPTQENAKWPWGVLTAQTNGGHWSGRNVKREYKKPRMLQQDLFKAGVYQSSISSQFTACAAPGQRFIALSEIGSGLSG